MIYLGCQHCVKMILMWCDDMVSSSECSSGLTWHMFMHVVESNQHSLHDIYVHGRLYPTHACTRCELILMHAYDCCRSLSWSLPILLLAFTCTKREYCLCIQTP